jgi:uncharacterized protein YifN (PemK superfamily)
MATKNAKNSEKKTNEVVVVNQMSVLDSLFAEAGISASTTAKEKLKAYQAEVLTTVKEDEVINKQHENWSEAYQAQRTAAVKLGQYRTKILGLPKGCRKFSHGHFKTTQVWESIKETIDAEVMEKYLAMEAAIENLC